MGKKIWKMEIKIPNMESIKKHQDYIYLEEDYIDKPKDSFFFLNKIIKKYKKKKLNNLLDVGCAKGEFLFFLSKIYKKNIQLEGVDYSKKLLKEAKKRKYSSDIKFYKKNAYNLKLKKKFDFIIVSGVVCYFDKIEFFLKNILKSLKSNGKLIIFDNFNKYDVDIILRYRNNKYSKKFEPGWNTHSVETIKRFLNKKKFKIQEIKKFNLSFKLKKKKDPCRSWHIKINNRQMFTTGLMQYFDLEALVIGKAKSHLNKK